MKKKLSVLFLVFLCASIFAQETAEADQNQKLWSFNVVSDFIYAPKTDSVAGEDHFAPVTKAFGSIQNRESGHAVYSKNFALGNHPILQYANLTVDLGMELTIIDVAPKASVSFSPVPFLTFSAGGMFGIGWSYPKIDGLCQLNKSTGEYEQLTPFKNNYYECWGLASFQFDTGVFIPGDWSHVIMKAAYQVVYKGMTGMENGDIWMWQGEPAKTNGLQYVQSYLLGYNTPTIFNCIGCMATLFGYYDSQAYGKEFESYDADFMGVNFSPLIDLVFGNETIDIICNISSRRSFKEEHTDFYKKLYLTQSGREWYFGGLIISWKHTF